MVMETHTQVLGPRHDVAVAALATYIHEEMGVDDSTARAKASKLVDDAREIVARVEPPSTWWSIALRGILAIAVGVIFIQRPIETVTALVLVLGVWICLLYTSDAADERSSV